jgi:hypothetical protein
MPRLPEDTARRAESYPFDVPLGSYSLCAGGVTSGPMASLHDRTPVLALGANAAPSQLAAKLPGTAMPIPVTRAVLGHFAVVHAAELSPEGYLPPVLQRHRGTSSYIFITWLTDEQLDRMHTSEQVGRAADYRVLRGVQIEDERGGVIDQAGVYLRRAGPLVHRGRPIRVAEVPTTGCTLPALTQRAAIRLAHRLVAAPESYPDFVARLVVDAAYRAAVNAVLARHRDLVPG